MNCRKKKGLTFWPSCIFIIIIIYSHQAHIFFKFAELHLQKFLCRFVHFLRRYRRTQNGLFLWNILWLCNLQVHQQQKTAENSSNKQ